MIVLGVNILVRLLISFIMFRQSAGSQFCDMNHGPGLEGCIVGTHLARGGCCCDEDDFDCTVVCCKCEKTCCGAVAALTPENMRANCDEGVVLGKCPRVVSTPYFCCCYFPSYCLTCGDCSGGCFSGSDERNPQRWAEDKCNALCMCGARSEGTAAEYEMRAAAPNKKTGKIPMDKKTGKPKMVRVKVAAAKPKALACETCSSFLRITTGVLLVRACACACPRACLGCVVGNMRASAAAAVADEVARSAACTGYD